MMGTYPHHVRHRARLTHLMSLSAASPLVWNLGRLRTRRGNAEAFQCHRHDVGEDRAGGGAAAGIGVRFIEYDISNEPRVVGRRETDKGHRVLAFHIASRVRVDTPRRTGLTGDPVTLDGRGVCGAVFG